MENPGQKEEKNNLGIIYFWEFSEKSSKSLSGFKVAKTLFYCINWVNSGRVRTV